MFKFKNVHFQYEKENKEIIKGVGLCVRAKERIVITGASGSGKSTLLKLLAGFIPPTNGKIIFDNQIVSQNGEIIVPSHQRNIAMVFQDLALWPHMNIEENIEFGLKIKGLSKELRKEKVNEFLSLVGLEGYNTKRVEELSGGQQQRVALARALIVSPKILLMDEPLSSLDEKLNIRLRQEIVALQKKLGFILIYVTHNKEEAQYVGNRIMHMEEGCIVDETYSY